jgi:hypothetical protein
MEAEVLLRLSILTVTCVVGLTPPTILFSSGPVDKKLISQSPLFADLIVPYSTSYSAESIFSLVEAIDRTFSSVIVLFGSSYIVLKLAVQRLTYIVLFRHSPYGVDVNAPIRHISSAMNEQTKKDSPEAATAWASP